MSTTSSLRVCVQANHNRNLETVVVVAAGQDVWTAVQKLSKNKLRFAVKRWFHFASSRELGPDNAHELVTNGSIIVASKGEDLIGGGPSSRPSVVKVIGQEDAEIYKSPHIDVLIKEAWLEDGAVQQLEQVVRDLPCLCMAFGMPDLHPGKRYPIGAVFCANSVIYPALVGGDIGCGMSLCQLSIKADRATEKQVGRWVEQIGDLEAVDDSLFDAGGGDLRADGCFGAALGAGAGADYGEGGGCDSRGLQHLGAAEMSAGEATAAIAALGIDVDSFLCSMGTIGGGNHFAELQRVDKVFVDGVVDESALYLLVHSGSRGLGAAILSRHIDCFGDAGLHMSTPEAAEYLELHGFACAWARRNRRRITDRFATAIGAKADETPLLDIWHNNVALYDAPVADGRRWICKEVPPFVGVGTSDADARLSSLQLQEISTETGWQSPPLGLPQAACLPTGAEGAKQTSPHDATQPPHDKQKPAVAKLSCSASNASDALKCSGTDSVSTQPRAEGSSCQQEGLLEGVGDAGGRVGTAGKVWVHRKGAAPSDQGLVVIPGSRGTFSYLVEPTRPSVRSGFSLAHGAGRKWPRGKALACVRSRYPNPDDLRTTALAGRVICGDRNLLFEEAPEAYKDIEVVVQDLVDAGLIRVVARLRPIITYKTAAAQ